ncbi:MAG: maleylpyruvate isomerase family mycothiol-dependent enzyme [Nocardioides sp.]
MAHSLVRLVEIWWQAINDFSALLETVEAAQWSLPTDLEGWDVHAIAAHTAHLESLLAGAPHVEVEVGEPAHVTGLLGHFTEQGVVARRDRTPDELITEIRTSAITRRTALLDEPPQDAAAPAPGVFGLIGWTTERLLRNRPLDVWMHEQDVRRAIGRPGNLDGPAAVHTADYLAESLGFVLVKRGGAGAGTTAVLEVDGHPPHSVVVDDDGRGRTLDAVPNDPTVRLAMSRETFILLAGGRRSVAPGAVMMAGDVDLGGRVVAGLAVTP